MEKKRKEIQTARMWRYFLDAASELIKTKSLHEITIREIADKAGFTSSTVYNYFKDLSHLKFFAVMRLQKRMCKIYHLIWKRVITLLKNGYIVGSVSANIHLKILKFMNYCILKIKELIRKKWLNIIM